MTYAILALPENRVVARGLKTDEEVVQKAKQIRRRLKDPEKKLRKIEEHEKPDDYQAVMIKASTKRRLQKIQLQAGLELEKKLNMDQAVKVLCDIYEEHGISA